MGRIVKKRKDLNRRHQRVRRKIKGTAERPRFAVYRSLRHIYAQLIDDVAGTTILSVSSQSKDFPTDKSGGNAEGAKVIGTMLAEKAKEKSITSVVFDRGGRQFHGRVKSLADGAREGGLQF